MRRKIYGLILLVVLYSLVSKYAVGLQGYVLERQINGLTDQAIQGTFGDDLYDVYKAFEEEGYTQPDYTYVKLSKNEYLISIDTILYGRQGQVLETRDAYMRVTTRKYLGLEVLEYDRIK